MMISLNLGGRCAVVVPDGMLVNESGCHNKTRKYLLEHFEVKRVIKMKGKFFMNTSIQPSVVFFENTRNPTTHVEFWDVVRDVNGNITETMVLSVPREKINSTYSLDMQRYVEVKEVPNLTGFPVVKLEDVCDILGGKGNYTQDGDIYPYYDSNGIKGFRNNYLYDGEHIVTARKLSIGSVHYVVGKYWPSDNTINIRVKLNSKIALNRFVYYWILLNSNVLKKMSSGIKPGIRKSDVGKLILPFPSLERQQQTIEILDNLQQQLDSLESLQRQSESNARFILESYLSCPQIVSEPTPIECEANEEEDDDAEYEDDEN